MTDPQSSDRVSILLVDDQPAKLLAYETILDELGENLIKASSATEALDCLLRNEIALVLVDVCMPDLDGYELVAMIRQHPRFRRIAIIFVSAVMMTDLDRLRGYESGAVDYVPVPVVPEILRAKVSVFVDLYKTARALERLNAELEQRVASRTAALEATTGELREADRRKNHFLAMLAHELRNPLAPIRTAVELLRLKTLSEADGERARDVIERQLEHLVRLIDDLLDISRITNGLMTLRRAPVTVESIVRRAVETAKPALDARRHELTVEIPAEPMTLDADEIRLIQVLSNVLNNASKFSDAGGGVSLVVERSGESVVITVKDRGIGIAAEDVSRIFEPFTQLQAASGRHRGGLGIGLALVRRIVEMHGGRVSAHSDGPGQGTQVTALLPLTQPLAEPMTEAAPAVPEVDGRRILVADDNVDAAEALALQLRLAGHDVRVALDGVQAVDTARAFAPDVVVLDLGMPRMDGFETAREIRRLPTGRQVALIALTGWGQQHDRDRTLEAGFDVHLVKPVTQRDLMRAIVDASTESPARASDSAVRRAPV